MQEARGSSCRCRWLFPNSPQNCHLDRRWRSLPPQWRDPCILPVTALLLRAKYRGLSTAHDIKPSCFGRDDKIWVIQERTPLTLKEIALTAPTHRSPLARTLLL